MVAQILSIRIKWFWTTSNDLFSLLLLLMYAKREFCNSLHSSLNYLFGFLIVSSWPSGIKDISACLICSMWKACESCLAPSDLMSKEFRILAISLAHSSMFELLFWLRVKNKYGFGLDYFSSRICNFSEHRLTIWEVVLSRLPFVLIITMSEMAKQNRTSFVSKLFLLSWSFSEVLAMIPSVSIKNIPSHPNISPSSKSK